MNHGHSGAQAAAANPQPPIHQAGVSVRLGPSPREPLQAAELQIAAARKRAGEGDLVGVVDVASDGEAES